MDTPNDMNRLLKGILDADSAPKGMLDQDDLEFIDRIKASCNDGSQGLLLSIDPNGRMKYILVNVSKLESIPLLTKIIERIASTLKE